MFSRTWLQCVMWNNNRKYLGGGLKTWQDNCYYSKELFILSFWNDDPWWQVKCYFTLWTCIEICLARNYTTFEFTLKCDWIWDSLKTLWFKECQFIKYYWYRNVPQSKVIKVRINMLYIIIWKKLTICTNVLTKILTVTSRAAK